jgi:hypothetical protein
MSDLHLKKFDPATIRPYSTILFAGGRRTGKSFVMRDFLWHLRKRVYDANVFSGTIDEDHPWEKLAPPHMVQHCLEEFPKDILQQAIVRQERRKRIAAKYDAHCPASMLVLEDLEHLQPPIWKDQSMRTIIFNGRWSKTYCLVAFQYLMEVKMAMRGSFDYAVFCMENSAAVRERIWKQFASIFPNFNYFENAFFGCTQDYKVMVVDCRARSYNIEDAVFWYKAKDRGTYRIGAPDSWIVPSKKRRDDPETERDRKKAIEESSKRGNKKKLDAVVSHMKVRLVDDDEEKSSSSEEEDNKKKKKKNNHKKH